MNKTQQKIVWTVAVLLSLVSVSYGIVYALDSGLDLAFGEVTPWLTLFVIPIILIGAAAFLNAWAKRREGEK